MQMLSKCLRARRAREARLQIGSDFRTLLARSPAVQLGFWVASASEAVHVGCPQTCKSLTQAESKPVHDILWNSVTKFWLGIS